MLLINLQTSKSNPKSAVDYLLFGTKDRPRAEGKAEILAGNPQLFLETIRFNPYKSKTYNFLVSFKESKEELEEKLKEQGKTIEELHDEIIDLLTAGFSKDELNLLSVAHSDTDNYHFHIRIDTRNLKTDKKLNIPRTRLETDYYQAIAEYISLRYNISLDTEKRLYSTGKIGLEKVKGILRERGTYKNQARDEIREEITAVLIEQINAGTINSRNELIKALEDIGIEIVRKGKNYITIRFENQKIRLKGGIYDERGIEKIKRKVKGDKTETGTDNLRELRRAEEKLRRLQQKRIQAIKRRNKSGERSIRKGTGELEQAYQKSNNKLLSELERVWSISRSDIRRRDRILHRENSISKADGKSDSFTAGKEWGSENYEGRRRMFLSSTAGISLLHRQEMETGTKRYMPYSYAQDKWRKMMKKWEEKRKQEIELIKSIPPEEVLNDLDIPYTKRPSYYECRAVWRGDKNPSLSVFRDGPYWKWKDHATGKAGSWIDLYMVAKGWDYITAVKYLRETFIGADIKTLVEALAEPEEEWQISEIKEKPISKPVIKRFLQEERQIKHIPEWLKQVEYEVFNAKTGEVKRFFGFGIKDKAGNYHIRYATNKTAVKERVLRTNEQIGTTYSLIPNNSKAVIVVEGMIDGIRAEELFGKQADILILNGVENYKKALPQLEKYEKIIIATDQDNAGEKVAKAIAEEYLFEKEIYRLQFDAKDLDRAVRDKVSIELENIINTYSMLNHRPNKGMGL